MTVNYAQVRVAAMVAVIALAAAGCATGGSGGAVAGARGRAAGGRLASATRPGTGRPLPGLCTGDWATASPPPGGTNPGGPALPPGMNPGGPFRPGPGGSAGPRPPAPRTPPAGALQAGTLQAGVASPQPSALAIPPAGATAGTVVVHGVPGSVRRVSGSCAAPVPIHCPRWLLRLPRAGRHPLVPFPAGCPYIRPAQRQAAP